ncbi:MAG: glycoside hydrolase [Prevotella sp.]|nr:glycoside hydrolase [Prevotella sp.]
MRKLFLTMFWAGSMLSGHATDYNIRQYGAVSDTTKLSTEAIQQAIDACSKAGGGRVVVPSGQYKTGSLELRSDVELHLEHGATLYGSTDVKDYRPMKSNYVSLRTQSTTIQLLYADNVSNVVISGTGTIDGRGAAFPKLSWNDEGITRPHLLRFIQSQDITIKDVTLRNSGCWMQHYLACDRLKIDGIKVFNRNNYNNDALDLDGCHDVIVTDMLADSDDDAITLKSTSPRLCENVRISNCVVSSHCNAIKLGTESNGGYRNISISGIVVKPSADQSSKFFGNDRGTSVISLEVVDGGVLENVQVSNIVAEGTEVPIFVRLGNRARGYYEGQQISHVGTLRNVTISDVTVRDAGSIGSSITGLPGHNVEDITLRNISIEHRGGGQKTAVPADEKEKEYPEGTMWGMLPAQGFFVRHARGVVFENIKIRALSEDKRPEYVREDAD